MGVAYPYKDVDTLSITTRFKVVKTTDPIRLHLQYPKDLKSVFSYYYLRKSNELY